jgi:hypothetical protein
VRSFRLASARWFPGSWSATQSGASSVGPSEHVGGKWIPPCLFAEGPARRRSARRPSHIGPFLRSGQSVLPRLKPSLDQDSAWDRTPLGLETAAPYQPRAALAVEGSGKTQETSASKVPALHREAERDTTGSNGRQHPVHTWIGRRAQAKRRSAATLCLICPRHAKVRLTLWF